MENENRKQKGKKKSDKQNQEPKESINDEQKNEDKSIILCVDCDFREVNKNTHKKNHWMISLQDLFKEINPLLQQNNYLYVNKPYRSKMEELYKIIDNSISSLTLLKQKLNLGSTPQQKLMEAIDEYNQRSNQDNLGNLIVAIQKSLKVTDSSDSKSFFEILDGNEDSVCSLQQAEQILKDLDKLLLDTHGVVKQFTLQVEVKDKPLEFVISEQNINSLYKEVEGATSIKLKEQWCSDDLEPLYSQISKSLQNNQTAQSLEINLSKLAIQDKGGEMITKSIRYIKPITLLSLNFNDCELGNTTIKSIAKLIESSKSIKNIKLNMANNSIKHEGIKALSKSIATNKYIDTFSINLKNNHLGADGVKQLTIGIGTNVSIKVLKLHIENNQIGNKGIECIVDNLSKNKVIKNLELSLQYNNISYEGVVFLHQGLIQISQAQEMRINLSKNQIDDNGAIQLFQAIKDNEYTKQFSLYLNDNKIKDETSKDILTQIDQYLEAKKAKNPLRFNEAIIFSF
ncbi:hypothetical protein TTHERM_00853060 (macronuclear) [Tetrahymena thermophila SB210]|uniref:Kinase domain protein n=1 Tax=Tetrahymena thermophila (strain SB210) TaxID=312017 RepID=Q24E34_TETTS|nr:hypothetical protein TTHERM_00853060 [Tetrahymena thermophila SB210]EAS06067.2 hypothetical protein TTHERM_00853060 [Tetrahymena thermophila SB210]|eukprot:XP_001026312.2 hypothetical protein TTHERM_00853060 [Tetrahymena thermophila SB210]